MTAMVAPFSALSPASHRPHALHRSCRDWPETNCYVDLWIEVLAALGHDPAAAFGFTAAQDFEGDQFTFFKFPPEDLAELYDLHVQELAIYDTLETHAAEQISRGRLVLMEVDAFHLPDARGVSYGLEHTKTTIAIARIDAGRRQMEYFHNAGYFLLEGADYDGVLQRLDRSPDLLFPYVEFVKLGRRETAAPFEAALRLLRKHVGLAPTSNPVRAFADCFAARIDLYFAREPEFFHKFAFNTVRQLGANFELLSAHLDWIGARAGMDLSASTDGCRRLSAGAKSFQFQLARAMARKSDRGLAGALDELSGAWEQTLNGLHSSFV